MTRSPIALLLGVLLMSTAMAAWSTRRLESRILNAAQQKPVLKVEASAISRVNKPEIVDDNLTDEERDNCVNDCCGENCDENHLPEGVQLVRDADGTPLVRPGSKGDSLKELFPSAEDGESETPDGDVKRSIEANLKSSSWVAENMPVVPTYTGAEKDQQGGKAADSVGEGNGKVKLATCRGAGCDMYQDVEIVEPQEECEGSDCPAAAAPAETGPLIKA